MRSTIPGIGGSEHGHDRRPTQAAAGREPRARTAVARSGGVLAGMEPDKAAGLIAVAWLIVAILLIARLIRQGRELAAALAARHPETYEALGRPRPGYFYSASRTRFAQFVARREYEQLGDPALAARFEDYRKAEARLLLSLLLSLAVVGLLVMAVRYAA